MGSAVHDKPADIVIYADDARVEPWIIVEVKEPNRRDGIDQLKSYMNAAAATFGYWTNGTDEKFLLRSGANDFSKPIWRLPNHGETLVDIDEPVTRSTLQPVKDLFSMFKDMEQEILAHQSVDTVNEIFKVVFAKLFDERVNLHNDAAVAELRIGLQERMRKQLRAHRPVLQGQGQVEGRLQRGGPDSAHGDKPRLLHQDPAAVLPD
jgi:type I restriction enzyme M protein